jgi:CRP/FNR family cyclic AMP-dependent transcriptional regulator
MTWISATGYLASALVFISFCMRRMMPLRAVAAGSNVCFIAYGLFGHIYPVFLLHLVLLPMNGWRTFEMMRLIRRIEIAGGGDFPLQPLRPFMRTAHQKAGEILFRRGDAADRLYVITKGEIVLEQIDHVIRPGAVFGEIALFSAEHRRTQTARCLSDVDLLWITEESLAQVCYQSPETAFHLLRLITNRLIADLTRLEAPPPAMLHD